MKDTEDPKQERTLVIIKPDGVQRMLVGEIVARLERVGLQLVAIKMVQPSAEMIERHYTLDPEWRRITGEKTIASYKEKGLAHPDGDDPYAVTAVILEKLKRYMTDGPVIAMIWRGAHSVKLVRKLVGGTEPISSPVGTIRGDFMHDSYQLSDREHRSILNLVHASGSVKEAEDEIAHWFEKSEIFDYPLIQHAIWYGQYGKNRGK